MKATPQMVGAALEVALQHGLLASTGMSFAQFRDVLGKMMQAALDADAFLAQCTQIQIVSDTSQFREAALLDATATVANCNIKLFLKDQSIEAAGA